VHARAVYHSGVFACVTLGCARPPAPQVPPIQLSWTPFYWVRASTPAMDFRRASILFHLPVRPGSAPRLVQLDLGGSGNLPDGLPEPAGTVRTPRPQGQLYGLLGARAKLEVATARSDSGLASWRREEIGTVGLPNYLREGLILDFVHDRLASVPRPATADVLAANALAVFPLERGEFDRVLLPLTTPGGRTYQALLDTGLSPFSLWASQAVWKELTGLEGPSPGTRSYRLPNPLEELVFIGAPARRQLSLGPWRLPRTEVVYLAQGPARAGPEEWRPPADLILGPSLFAGHATRFVDLPRRRAALLKPLPR